MTRIIHDGQEKGGKQKSFVSDSGKIFAADDQTDLIHSLRLSRLKLTGKGSAFHQFDKNFV